MGGYKKVYNRKANKLILNPFLKTKKPSTSEGLKAQLNKN